MFRLLPLGGATAAILFGATLAACGGDNGPADPNPPPPPAGDLVLSVVGGGHNVEDRFTSDLWVHGSHAYTGTWGFRGAGSGNAVKIWSLGAGGAPVLADSIVIQTISTVSDIEVSDDGQVLLASAEGGTSKDYISTPSSIPNGPSCSTANWSARVCIPRRSVSSEIAAMSSRPRIPAIPR